MALTAGTISIASVTRSTVSLQATPSVGGTGLVTYQWYRSTIPNFTPSLATLMSGQVNLTLNDSGLSTNTGYYYILQATDTVPVTVSYVQMAILTDGPSISGFKFPQAIDFKNYFTRDFPYGTDPSNTILDNDIVNAMQMSNIGFFNPIFFADQASFNVGYLLLSAHYLVMNIRRSTQGLNGQFNFLQNSKSAGISESFSIPQRILDNPDFSWLCKSNYGAQYLSMILPQLTGQMFPVISVTNP